LTDVLVLGVCLVLTGLSLLAATVGRSRDWPPLARNIPFLGWGRLAPPRDRLRAIAIIATALGVLELVRATWLPA
jgi:hypothetical protein